jgi:hypothetical protein
MKKLFLTLGAILVFGLASAQTTTSKAKATKTKTQTDRAKKADTRTPAQQKSDAEKNINAFEENNIPTPPASAAGNVNTNSSAMPQVTPPVTTPPPGAPINPEPVGTPIRRPSKP